jgi:hypothetical protein
MNTTTMRNDRIYPATRWLAAIIVPFLIAAFYLLYLRTSETKQLFAWEIKAPMSAMMLASAYIGGAYFFARAVFAPRWHQIGMGFLPVTAFASFMGIATLLHLDRFNQGNISFFTWELLYFTTPFLVLGAWLWNRRTDPGTPEPGDFVLPRIVRYVIGGAALANLLISLGLFLQPNVMVALWPWPLTALTARVISSMFALQGVFGLCLALDPRWSAARILLESQWLSMLFILIAIWRTWSTLDQTKPFTWVFVGSIVTILAVVPMLYAYVETRRRKSIGLTPAL